MNRNLFLSTFSLIFVAELPDKTALATLILATQGRPWPIFVGVATAFVVQSMIAVSFGNLITYFPARWVHLGTGIFFLVFAALAWRRSLGSGETEEMGRGNANSSSFARTAWNAFVVIFIAEWGDLTQLASASLVARYAQPLTIFAASVLALWTTTAIAILVGNKLKEAVNPMLIQRVAAAAFAGVGIYFILTWIRS